MTGFRTAVSLLTRVSVGRAWRPADLARSLPWFPLVGGLLGLILAASYAGLLVLVPPLVAATLTVGMGVGVTGAFHEDGLGDTADALGGGTQEEALRILKDPAHGTYGVLAIVLSVVLRAGALAALDAWTALAVLPAVHAISRAAPVSLLAVMRPARENGLGSAYSAAVTKRRFLGAVVMALLIGLATSGGWAILAAIVTGLVAWTVGGLAVRKIGGVTGDVLGAAQQVGETLMLLLAAAFVTNGWPSPAWWR